MLGACTTCTGNVWEWCQDRYDVAYYKSSPPDDPTGPSTGSYRVRRGGSWSDFARDCRSAFRFGYRPDSRNFLLGFRVALVPAESAALPSDTMPPPKPEPETNTSPSTPPDPMIDLFKPEILGGSIVPETNTSPSTPPDAALETPEHTNSIGMQFKLIPAGEFLMGSPGDAPDKSADEIPQHRVRITKPFYLGINEVTQEQYEEVMDKNPSKFKGSSLPVETVSWEDATQFCKKLSELDGKNNYRLPTEAEWEYACRAGTTTRYSCGDELDSDCAWFSGNSGNQTHPVGEKRPNAWGFYDMHGNVLEWCSDWYDSDYYGSSPSADPTGPSTGSNRVIRGGSWDLNAGLCRSANRNGRRPDRRYDSLGFRVALVPAE